jgi:hypothetical protein
LFPFIIDAITDRPGRCGYSEQEKYANNSQIKLLPTQVANMVTGRILSQLFQFIFGEVLQKTCSAETHLLINTRPSNVMQHRSIRAQSRKTRFADMAKEKPGPRKRSGLL